jgi:malate dehydrogenase (oxaloacetate-decarboxylating)
VDRHGLVVAGDPELTEGQRRYGRDQAEVADWQRDAELGGIPLAEVVRRVHPTVLIGTSARPGAFNREIIIEMALHADRPVIMPMSNPTELAEATPADIIAWTGGRALVATGSPFPPVDYQGTRYTIGQANNALVFPGLGLGAIAVRASRVTDSMLSAAAHAVAALVDTSEAGAPLLPQVEALRDTSLAVAVAVAGAAAADGVAVRPLEGDVAGQIHAMMWQPTYRPVRPG